MGIRRETSEESEIINMSSLLDVMFILIIFFLATTTFQEEERDIEVSLPSDSSTTLSAAEKVIVINVRRDSAYVVLNRQMTVEEMTMAIQEEIKKDPDKKVLVRADREALHGYVARAISICKQAGIKKANIGYQIDY